MIKIISLLLLLVFALSVLQALYYFWQKQKNTDNLIYKIKYKHSFAFLFIITLFLISFPFTQVFIPYYAFELGGKGLQPQALKGLNEIRVKTGKRWKILSAYRDLEYNKKVGGALQSMHVQGLAFDVNVPYKKRAKFYEAAKQAGFTAFGWGNKSVHIDMGSKRWWTYDDKGRAVSGQRKYEYLHKAPENFKQDLEN